MDICKNFGTHCTVQEAIKLVKYAPVSVMKQAETCYYDAYKFFESDGWISANYNGLSAIYMLGFLSGARAVRGARVEH